MQPDDHVNVEEIMREVREKARQRRERTPAFARFHPAITAPSALENVIVTQLGEMPPAPPTLRARVGSIAVRAVYHLLHWYTVRLRQFATAVVDTTAVQANALKSVSDAVDEVGRTVQAHAEANGGEIEVIRRRIGELDERILQLSETVSQLLQAVSDLPQIVSKDVARIEQLVQKVRTEQIVQDRRITTLLEEARRRLPDRFDTEQLEKFVTDGSPSLKALYVTFEDQFRGTREDIADRLRFYVPYVASAKSVIDVGCGRGEWIELLRAEGIHAEGIDSNPVMVDQCRQRGLSVHQADFLEHLRSLPDQSVDAITSFHLIEHLPWDVFVTFLDEAVRLLRPRGVLIIETPNPENLQVGAHNFYIDPTHVRPLPSPLTRFIVEQRGFCNVEVFPLHPYPPCLAVPMDGSEVVERFNHIIYGPQDYGVIARKP